MKAKSYAAAQAKFEAALKVNPRFAEAHNNLAFCLRKQSPANYNLRKAAPQRSGRPLSGVGTAVVAIEKRLHATKKTR